MEEETKSVPDAVSACVKRLVCSDGANALSLVSAQCISLIRGATRRHQGTAMLGFHVLT